MTMEWCIFYSDGSEISNLDCEPQNVTTRGVLAIAQIKSDCGWYIVQGGDYYFWDDRGDGFQWHTGDIEAKFDYEIKPGWKKILAGITISDDEYDEVFSRVKRDPRFPRKYVFDRGERQP